MKERFVIAIDGPAGSGKSSVARLLAKRLGAIHLNSGLLYRSIALAAIEKNIPFDDEAGMARLASTMEFFHRLNQYGETEFLVVGQDISARLATPEISRAASEVAVYPDVRDKLTRYQRQLGEKENLVLEGRDAGTVVFPETPWKFYLDAPLEVRAERRLQELDANSSMTRENVRNELKKRDERDQTRSVAPAQPAQSAIHINTTGLSLEDVLKVILNSFPE